jgi:hypothetical protein
MTPWETHLLAAVGGGVGTAILAHAVNTMPVPANIYGRWLLGVVQFAVGQITRSANTISNMDTVAQAVPKKPNGNGN